MNSNFVKPGMIQIGYEGAGIIDSRYERTIIEISGDGRLVFQGRAFIGSASRLCTNGNLEFGSKVNVTGRSDFICFKNIKIGSGSLISWDCIFMDTDFHKICSDGKIVNGPQPIFVGENCWIGCRAAVLKGSNIPDGSVVGAGSVVCGKLAKGNSVYAGNPAKMIKENIRWEK